MTVMVDRKEMYLEAFVDSDHPWHDEECSA